LVDSLRSLSTFFPENNIRTRRNLRSEIEKKSLLLNEQFLNAFKVVKDQLDDICSDIDCMAKCCDNMTSRLKVI
jgi:conserved oligomeric Golgi complex subunit 6